jgi:hypothetical protein
MGVLVSFSAANGNNLNKKRFKLRTECRETFRRFKAAATFTSKLDEMTKFQRAVREYVLLAESKVDHVRICVLTLLRHRRRSNDLHCRRVNTRQDRRDSIYKDQSYNTMSAKSQRKKNDDTMLAFSRANSFHEKAGAGQGDFGFSEVGLCLSAEPPLSPSFELRRSQMTKAPKRQSEISN